MTTTLVEKTTGDGQMEMALEAARGRRESAPNRRVRRAPVARWWFARMREAVRSTTEWSQGASAWAAADQPQLSLTGSPLSTRLSRRREAGCL